MFKEPPLELDTLQTSWLGRPLLFIPEVDSTNRLLRELAQAGTVVPGSVILTDYQQAGRGRQGRGWEAPAGSSLLFSLLLQPEHFSARYSLLPLVLAVAVAQTLEAHLGLAPKLKWPNDVLLDGRKCCGILVESEIEGSGEGARIVAGIGLNVNQDTGAFVGLPEATSLRVAVGKATARGPLLAALLYEIERCYDDFQGGWEPHEAWRQRSALLNQPIIVQPQQGRPWQGTARDLAPDGSLLVEQADGSTQAVHAADVRIRSTL